LKTNNLAIKPMSRPILEQILILDAVFPDDFEIPHEALETLRHQLNDEAYCVELQRFLLLRHCPDIFDLELQSNKPILLYNLYYRFKKFMKLFNGRHGHDAGMEQQAFQLLESATFEIDWNVIQEIEDRVAREAGQPNT
jgi:hypothetical protein